MRAIINLIMAVAILLAIASCESKSGKLTKIKREEETQGYHSIVVENSPEIYKKVSDKIVRRKADLVFFERRCANVSGECRYYRVR